MIVSSGLSAGQGSVSSFQVPIESIERRTAGLCSPAPVNSTQARFRDHTTTLFEKHGIDNIGYWVPADAPRSDNTLIYIVAPKSRSAATQSWQAFRKDPAWMKARAASEANGRLVSKIDNVFMTPTDFSPAR